ncbi:ATP-binding protein [Acidiplasma sp.]|uniref:ATP-binding protein n=1 Tax=Acidiplasma sp. TaxID=1872114 RepID=UPI002584A218|nr:ATP-binding protein [Acidiplasma sp.]
MLQQFINRKYELEFLNDKYNENKRELIIIYGRRRIGKTMLIKQFIENKKYIYHLCTLDSMEDNIDSLKNQFSIITGKDYFNDLKSNFYEVFKYFIREIKSDKIIIVLDEFPNLIALNHGIISIMQKIFDELMDTTRLYIILSGSSISMMEDELLSYKSPLYGRRTGSLEINGFDINNIKYFYNSNIDDLIKINAVFGNIPFYLSLIDKNKSIEENIKHKILKKGEILYEEPKILLKEEFKEPRIYEMILRHISLGHNTYGEIVNGTHMDRGNISKYLETLVSVKLINYILPLNQKRRGIYEINDYFLNFYYNFVYPNLSDLEINRVNDVMEIISRDINTYYGHAFERIIIDMIRNNIIELPFKPLYVNRFWHKEVEIDAIAANDETKEMAFIECKSKDNIDGTRIFNDLKYKSLKVDYNRNKEYYIIIAKSFKTKSDGAINIDFNALKNLVIA